MNKIDALGKAIVIGNTYGYSRQDGGWAHIVIGEAISETDKRVSIKVTSRRDFLYGKETDRHLHDKPVVSVQSNILFPVCVVDDSVYVVTQ